MYPQSQVKVLESKVASAKQALADVRHQQFLKQEELFTTNGGCTACRGRGWVVTWDTLDCIHGSYTEYGTCVPCGGVKGVLHPTNTKYDRWRGSEWIPESTPETDALSAVLSAVTSALKAETARWEVHAGCIVTAARKSTAKGALPKGIEATVIKHCQNPTKVWVKDSEGQSYWPKVSSLKVLCPKDSAPVSVKANEVPEKKEADVPKTFKVVVTKKTEKAALVVFQREGTFASTQEWVPFSQVPVLNSTQRGVATLIEIPDWLVKAKGIEQYAVAAVQAPVPAPVQAVTPVLAPAKALAASSEEILKALTANSPVKKEQAKIVQPAVQAPVKVEPVSAITCAPVSADVLDILFND